MRTLNQKIHVLGALARSLENRSNRKHRGRCDVDRECEQGRRPEGGQEAAWQHLGRAAGGNWKEPGEAGQEPARAWESL